MKCEHCGGEEFKDGDDSHLQNAVVTPDVKDCAGCGTRYLSFKRRPRAGVESGPPVVVQGLSYVLMLQAVADPAHPLHRLQPILGTR